jgi:PAS domain-containing protein
MTAGETVLEIERLRAIINAVPAYLLLVDSEARVQGCNASAADLTQGAEGGLEGKLCGEALRCLRQYGSGKVCGETESCDQCVVRQVIRESLAGDRVFRRKAPMQLLRNGRVEDVTLLVSGAPLALGTGPGVLLSLEDITELESLRRIIPMCAQCRKVRTDEHYWQAVSEYMTRHMGVDITHGLCPDCAASYLRELDGEDPSAAI